LLPARHTRRGLGTKADPIAPHRATLSPVPSALRQRLAASALAACLVIASGCDATAVVARLGPSAPEGGAPNDLALDAGRAAQAGFAGEAAVSVPESDRDCNKLEIHFASKVPAVFILVDRSSSMFERGLWEPLKAGVLAIVEQLQHEVRFGFTSYTGQAGGTCPELIGSVPASEGNFAAIQGAYDAIMPPSYKGETPTSGALDEVAGLLDTEPPETPKFILLVTDGEPDFCDDPNVTCSRDAVVASAQAARARGIQTFIFSVGGQVDPNHLQDVANAGAGLPVEDRQMAVHYQCDGGTAQYGTETGRARYYEPNVNDQKALIESLSGVVAGVRSCLFELQGKLKIDLAAADQGVVAIDGTPVPYGGDDGYRMNSATQLELLGGACEALRKPGPRSVLIDFPCEAVLLL
jgi:uncharacterized protein YegL